MVLSVEADQKAQFLLAEGAASPRREQGLAAAEAMRVLTEALQAAGPNARELFVLSQLDQLVGQVASKVNTMSIRELHVIDSGDGRALPALAASYPAIVTEVLSTLKDLTGVDIRSVLAAPASEGGAK